MHAGGAKAVSSRRSSPTAWRSGTPENGVAPSMSASSSVFGRRRESRVKNSVSHGGQLSCADKVNEAETGRLWSKVVVMPGREALGMCPREE